MQFTSGFSVFFLLILFYIFVKQEYSDFKSFKEFRKGDLSCTSLLQLSISHSKQIQHLN